MEKSESERLGKRIPFAERRHFIRVRAALEVRYKFLSHTADLGDIGAKIYRGNTANISAGGLLLEGEIPNPKWIQHLLSGIIVIGLNIIVPYKDMPLKVLSRVKWVEASKKPGIHALGLEFREITSEVRDAIVRYVIMAQLPD
jgi:c-di-GMP-binding flagellar brake protein YcgR